VSVTGEGDQIRPPSSVGHLGLPSRIKSRVANYSSERVEGLPLSMEAC